MQVIHSVVMCANVFIRKEGKYLLLRRSDNKKFAPGFVHPFGWRVEIGENPYEAAVREIDEEVWILLKNMKLEAVITELQPNKNADENRIIYHFSADYAGWTIGEIDEADGSLIYLDKDSIKEQNLFPSVRCILDSILDEKSDTVFSTMSYGAEESLAVLEKIHYCG